MDREIKFRAWIKERKIIREVCSIEFDDTGRDELVKYWDHPSVRAAKIKARVAVVRKKDVILLEYTGLTDCKGNEIYEKDILHFNGKEWGNGIGHNFAVTWVNEQACFGGAGTVSDWSEWCEVIGNIFENPELLEVK